MTRDIKDHLLNLLVTLLTPLFFTEGTDINFARLAALQTIEAYHAESRADLVTIAQIIAFGLAALGSLGLSMADDLSTMGILRLRSSATALSRAGERHRKILDNDRKEREIQNALMQATQPDPQQQQADLQQEQDARESVTQARDLATKAAKPASEAAQAKAMWAHCYTNVAEQTLAEMPKLPPAERPYASIRAAALSSTAIEIFTELAAARPPQTNTREATATPGR